MKEQIEQMAKFMHPDLCHSIDIKDCREMNGCDICHATRLYNAGYRKQEWISVDDRLPKVDTDVLVITANGSFKVARCNIYHNGTLVLWMTNDGLGEKAITHWMPLPDAPKMKGGAE